MVASGFGLKNQMSKANPGVSTVSEIPQVFKMLKFLRSGNTFPDIPQVSIIPFNKNFEATGVRMSLPKPNVSGVAVSVPKVTVKRGRHDERLDDGSIIGK